MAKSNPRQSSSSSRRQVLGTSKRRPSQSRSQSMSVTKSPSSRLTSSRSKTTSKRGFAAMSPQKRKQIAAKGGRARRAA